MRFQNVVLESLACALPPIVLTSVALEERLRPLYERLKLPFGRLELMTGIKERRQWENGVLPSEASARAIRAVLGRTAVPMAALGVLVHGAVSRDMLEPATAVFAHRLAALPAEMQILDVSNACLGFLNACTLVGGLIESGQVKAGLIACGENGGSLVEETIRRLNAGDLDRQQIKPYFANLTIGSAAVAAVLCHRDLAPAGAPRLVGGVARAATEHSALCQGDHTHSNALAMQTDSEQLLLAGVDTARKTWLTLGAEFGWSEKDFDRYVCHQVGVMHRRKLHETLGLDPAKDFSTFERFGNTGSAALPLTLACAREEGFIRPGHRVGLLGIGSGINCVMLALEC
jgi:3-oxoacyl-[acyl-carrier-protein] synthase III